MAKTLAFDLGASSGRAMLAEYTGGRITMQELHRFSNDPVSVNGTLHWDILRLFYEIKQGISKAVNAGGFDSIGIDTWGVDFGLIGPDGRLLANPVHYRDSRTDGHEEIYQVISPQELYHIAGMQQMQINTLRQLYYVKQHEPALYKNIGKVLFTPDLLNYFLTGVMKTEYTIASTSEMLDATQRDWSDVLLEKTGFDRSIFCDIVQPGTVCGTLHSDICEELGAPPAQVICIASHDTASAICTVPTEEPEFIYISSGTWSLLGAELKSPILSDQAMHAGFTNEGGAYGRVQFLKNIMGTWLSQECRRQWRREGKEYSFAELDKLAADSAPFMSIVDVDAPGFIRPGNMPRRIRSYCEQTGQSVPGSAGEMIRCVHQSLALKYKQGVGAISQLTGISPDTLYILGGGAKSELLCQMTADATSIPVKAGPAEATALGNAAIQMIALGEISGLSEARKIIARTEQVRVYKPESTAAWDAPYQKYLALTGAE